MRNILYLSLTGIMALGLASASIAAPEAAPGAAAAADEKIAAAKAVKLGEAAPDFTLNSADGKVVHLSDFKGKKVVVVYFYPKDETPGCTTESCAFRDKYDAFKSAGAEVIGISSDSVESHKKFAEHRKLPFILLSDPKGQVRKAWGVPSAMGIMPGRVTYVVDKDGVVRLVFTSMLDAEKHVSEAVATVNKLATK
jgi:peroxiredoxin Q/BCP